MKKNKKTLMRFGHDLYEHPFDRTALKSLKAVPGLDFLSNFISSNLIERIFRLQYTGSNLKVTEKNYPEIYGYLKYACEILDIEKVPELYIEWDYKINSFTVGAESPIIVLDSGVIDLCDEDEILFLIGRELGHIKSNHMLYHMMAQIFNVVVGLIPAGVNIAAVPLQAALLYWMRMSELSADRAGLLCCQNKDTVIKTITKMTGVPIKDFDKIDNDNIIRQAEQFRAEFDGVADNVIRTLSIATDDEPWTVYRASELLKWIEDGKYDKIINDHEEIKCDHCDNYVSRKYPTCHICGMTTEFL